MGSLNVLFNWPQTLFLLVAPEDELELNSPSTEKLPCLSPLGSNISIVRDPFVIKLFKPIIKHLEFSATSTLMFSFLELSSNSSVLEMVEVEQCFWAIAKGATSMINNTVTLNLIECDILYNLKVTQQSYFSTQ